MNPRSELKNRTLLSSEHPGGGGGGTVTDGARQSWGRGVGARRALHGIAR